MKQKGTGNARLGTRSTPLKPGGGVVFGPKVWIFASSSQTWQGEMAGFLSLVATIWSPALSQSRWNSKCVVHTHFSSNLQKEYVRKTKVWGFNQVVYELLGVFLLSCSPKFYVGDCCLIYPQVNDIWKFGCCGILKSIPCVNASWLSRWKTAEFPLVDAAQRLDNQHEQEGASAGDGLRSTERCKQVCWSRIVSGLHAFPFECDAFHTTCQCFGNIPIGHLLASFKQTWQCLNSYVPEPVSLNQLRGM